MKKTLSILLIAILTVSSIIGVTAAVKNTNNTTCTPDSITTTKSDVTTKSVATTKATSTQTATCDDELVVPSVVGHWKHEVAPKGYSIMVNWQNGNTLGLTIEAVRGNYAQIATADVSVTLDNVYNDGACVRGEGTFEYTDSFKNSGIGSISVSENVILLVIEETNSVSSWGIAYATGEYIYAGDGVEYDDTLVMPQLKTSWQKDNNPQGCSITVNSQFGNELYLTITSMRGNAAQIATADVCVTLDKLSDEDGFINGTGSFDYTDSFGNSGTGSVYVNDCVIILDIEQTDCVSSWGIANATGRYI